MLRAGLAGFRVRRAKWRRQVEKDARLSDRATVILLLLGLILVGCDKYTQCICFGSKVATCRYGLYERTRHRTDASDTQVKSGTPPRPESPPVFLFASRFDNPQAAYTLLRVGPHLVVQWCKSARYRPWLLYSTKKTLETNRSLQTVKTSVNAVVTSTALRANLSARRSDPSIRHLRASLFTVLGLPTQTATLDFFAGNPI